MEGEVPELTVEHDTEPLAGLLAEWPRSWPEGAAKVRATARANARADFGYQEPFPQSIAGAGFFLEGPSQSKDQVCEGEPE